MTMAGGNGTIKLLQRLLVLLSRQFRRLLLLIRLLCRSAPWCSITKLSTSKLSCWSGPSSPTCSVVLPFSETLSSDEPIESKAHDASPEFSALVLALSDVPDLPYSQSYESVIPESQGASGSGTPVALATGESGTSHVVPQVPRRGQSVTYPPNMPTPSVKMEAGRIGKPFGATQINRYNRHVNINLRRNLKILQADVMGYDGPKDSAPKPWRSCAHPEGSLYFCDMTRRIFTDDDMGHSYTRSEIEKCATQILELAKFRGIAWPHANLELVIKLVSERDPDTQRKQFRYYFIDIGKKLLLWLDDCKDPQGIFEGLQGVQKPSHIRKALEMQYWCVPFEVFLDLRDLIIHANAEAITSDTYLAPFEPEKLSKMMDIVTTLEGAFPWLDKAQSAEYVSTDQKCHIYREPLVVVIARFMHSFSRSQFFNFHGQRGARLDVDQSVYDSPENRDRMSILLYIAEWLLFGAPSSYSRELRRVWVDGIVNQTRWRAFIATLTTEWAGFTMYSTVMLAVDVSFLAVPGVDSATATFQSVAVIAIYTSTLCTVGSLVSSLILTSQSRRSARSRPGEVAQYMRDMSSSVIGTDYIAIMYSVPFGLLMWAMVLYLVGLMSVIFSSTYMPTLVTNGIGAGITGVFVAWPAWAAVGLKKERKGKRETITSDGKADRREAMGKGEVATSDSQQMCLAQPVLPNTSASDVDVERGSSLHPTSFIGNQ